MSLESFVKELLESEKDQLEQIAELGRLLEQIAPKQNSQIYLISVTSNW